MPKDNHSVMQLYLEGPKNNFFTFFYVKDNNAKKINNRSILSSHKFIKDKNFRYYLQTKKSHRKCIPEKKYSF